MNAEKNQEDLKLELNSIRIGVKKSITQRKFWKV